MVPLVFLGVILICLAAFLHVWRMRRFYYVSFALKGPTAWPFLGSALNFAGSTEDILQEMDRLVATYGTTFRLWLFGRLYIYSAEPGDTKTVLNNPNALGKEESYNYFVPLLGQGLFTANDVVRWRHNRKLISPAFNLRMLNSFVPIFAEQSLILCKKLETMVDKGIFDAQPYLALCLLDMVCETIMGIKIGAQLEESEYMHWMERTGTICYQRIFNVWFHFDCIFKWTKEGSEFKELIERLTCFYENLIRMKRKEHKIEKGSKQLKPEGKFQTFLDSLIKISEETGHFTNEELRNEVATFIFAGSDTSNGTIGFTLMMLGMHPEVQKKVFEELKNIFGQTDRPVTHKDLSNMRYLDRVIKETMRLFPVTPILGRRTTKDIKLSTCTIPKGASCVLGIFHIHRHPKYWPDPLRFDPDRFLPEEIAKRHPYTWIPFSAGPRNCIGFRYGIMTIKVVLSSVIRRFEVTCPYKSVEEVRVQPDFLLRAVEGSKISLRKRSFCSNSSSVIM